MYLFQILIATKTITSVRPMITKLHLLLWWTLPAYTRRSPDPTFLSPSLLLFLLYNNNNKCISSPSTQGGFSGLLIHSSVPWTGLRVAHFHHCITHTPITCICTTLLLAFILTSHAYLDIRVHTTSRFIMRECYAAGCYGRPVLYRHVGCI